MNLSNQIRKLNENASIVPGKFYYHVFRIKEIVPYQDTGNLHEICRCCWVEYNYSHSGNHINTRIIYSVIYDYKADSIEMDWFDEKCGDLFLLGFQWCESSGTFYLDGIWSAYWERVNRYDKKEWLEYLVDVVKAIKDKS